MLLAMMSAASVTCGLVQAARAEVTRIEIEKVTVVANKAVRAGDYEIITGRAYGAVDPNKSRG